MLVGMIASVSPPSHLPLDQLGLIVVGKEFCGHLFEPPSTSTSTPTNNQPVVQKKPCINCPGNCMSINNLVSPAPVPTANEGFIVHPPTPTPTLEEQEQAHQETMRCDEAWKKLKVN
jgi:hypothetical protein